VRLILRLPKRSDLRRPQYTDTSRAYSNCSLICKVRNSPMLSLDRLIAAARAAHTPPGRALAIAIVRKRGRPTDA
jgi:hypothetical protein